MKRPKMRVVGRKEREKNYLKALVEGAILSELWASGGAETTHAQFLK
ncbi:MAG: hypothetical protein IPN18_10350 [Ignavibacteriales bacterium]|nr:hypothetical protein [Ignavibacteriales bacterium]